MKKLIKKTISLCPECYKEIPASVFVDGNVVRMHKFCKQHGKFKSIVEKDADFYLRIKESYFPDEIYKISLMNQTCLVSVTNRCNLHCAHCYFEPDDNSKDRTIDEIIKQINNIDNRMSQIVLAGAEATVRKDLPELILKIKKLGREVHLLTNGVFLSDLGYTKNLKDAGLDMAYIGFHHKNYHNDDNIRTKQMQGIGNLEKVGIKMGYVSYTMKGLDELKDIIEEIQNFPYSPNSFKIRTSANIGRTIKGKNIFVSELYKRILLIAHETGANFKIFQADNNVYHITMSLGNKVLRLIHWADVHNIDLQELDCGPWANFVDGCNYSNFLHQIILCEGIKKGKLSPLKIF